MARAATQAQLKDPIADLMAEIEAEEAAAASTASKPAVAPVEEQTDAEATEEETASEVEAAASEAEAKTDADGGDQAGKEAAKPDEEEVKPKGKKGKVKAEDEGWRARLNDAEVKRRKAEQEAAAIKAELDALKNPKKDEPKKPPTVDEIREQVRAEERWKLRVADWTSTGNKEYGQDAFDAACNRIADVIGPDKPSSIVALSLEATDSVKEAVKATVILGQMDVPEIETFLKMSEYRQVATLARYASSRGRTKVEEDEPKPKPKAKRVDDDEAPPAPIRSVKGGTAVKDGMQALYDDSTDDATFYRTFEEQVMNKGARH